MKMRQMMPPGWSLVAACGAALLSGCQGGGKDSAARPQDRPTASISASPRTRPVEKKRDGASNVPVARAESPVGPRPVPSIPKVEMTARQSVTCLVKVGDRLPDQELPGTGRSDSSVRSLFGKRATIVLLWKAEDPYSASALEDLQTEFAGLYGAKGLAVVGIEVKGSPEVARKTIIDTGSKFPNLLDGDGKYFAKLATEGLPRLYLTDATAKILWLDIEYSSTTRHQLTEAVRAVLGDRP